jgi:acetate---CoA ligase (ADP-forming)
VPVIDGTEEGLRAIAALLRRRDRRLASHSRPAAIATERREYWRHRLQQPAPVREAEAMTLLADYGIDTPRFEVVSDLAGAIEAAERIGYCVVLKTAAAEIHHKTDVGGVTLGLTDSGALEHAYRRMAETLGPHAIVASQVPGGVEMAFGLLHDAQFGPYVLIAAGGLWIEALADRAVALPGLSIEQARTLVDGLRVAPMLGGGRGMAPADIEALARAFARFAMLAQDLGDLIVEMDVNPLLVSEHGCFAVDALVVTRASQGRPAGMEVMHGL